MSWLSKMLGIATQAVQSDGGVIGRGIDLIAERTEDVDKRNAAIVELVKLHLEAERDPTWLRALPHWPGLTMAARAALAAIMWANAAHLLGRVLLWGFVVYVGGQALAAGQITLEQFGALAAGPALYTLLKGRGR